MSIGSGEEILYVFTMYGHGGHLGHVIWTICINFDSCVPISFHIKFNFNISNVSDQPKVTE